LAITRQKKQELIQSYVDLLGQSHAVVLARSRGLSVAQVTQLRSKARELGSRYLVIKNTLFKQALMQSGVPMSEALEGSISATFCFGEITPVVGAIQKFADAIAEGEFEIVGGVLEKQVLDAASARRLATLPSKDTLFAQILAGINAPATQLSGIVASGIRQVLTVLQARADQLQESSPAA
jgi:large subunit ribosomal protein L10